MTSKVSSFHNITELYMSFPLHPTMSRQSIPTSPEHDVSTTPSCHRFPQHQEDNSLHHLHVSFSSNMDDDYNDHDFHDDDDDETILQVDMVGQDVYCMRFEDSDEDDLSSVSDDEDDDEDDDDFSYISENCSISPEIFFQVTPSPSHASTSNNCRTKTLQGKDLEQLRASIVSMDVSSICGMDYLTVADGIGDDHELYSDDFETDVVVNEDMPLLHHNEIFQTTWTELY